MKSNQAIKKNSARRIGEKRIMGNGMEAELIAYRGAADIDVRLSDGSIHRGKRYWAFKNGMLGPHLYHPVTDRTGERRRMNCGMEAEVIAYRKATDIDIRFSDGLVIRHRKYANFLNGSIGRKRSN